MGLENFSYSHTIGIASFQGRGFMNPVDVRLDSTGLLFVLSRSNAGNKDVRISAQTLDSEYLYEFGRWGTEPGQTTQPTAIAIDKDDRIYATDEFMHNVTVFNREGQFVDRWGEFGTGPGQFDRPSGIAIDSEGNIHVVDHLNARVQKLTPDGGFISSFGASGTAPGQFNFPWGISIDRADGIWIADWRNDRIQRFTKTGEFVSTLGSSGRANGQFDRPSGVHVSADGEVFVADWRNDRVQAFSEDGAHIETLTGDATLSKWCQEFLDVNPEQASWRENAGLFEQEKRFWRPSAVETSADGLVLIADSCRHRIQIYRHAHAAVPV
ncbi:MAG: NHL repeat-containing protein [Chloroflexi bacterium]|nr:NHL repeat-containing protein [Chloroflexota bacterium]MDA1297173.1 NHL repeat-containing protein [Chloroflexota bacterium]